MKLRYQVPAIYQRVLPSMLLDLDPVETKATCDACAMAPGRTRTKIKYQADLKCCTFHPWLPNFAVGALLRQENPSPVIRQKIRDRHYALPIGIAPPLKYQVDFNARVEQDFGNRADWLCPYYDRERNLCGVWRHRGSVCTSFYCKSDQGKDGKRFWRSFEDLLSYWEVSLMEEALVRLDFSPRQVSDLLSYLNRFEAAPEEIESFVLPEKKARELWNGYYDDQEGFYEKSLRVIENLSPGDLADAQGETGEFLLHATLASARCFR